jgi:TrmH family RNA methyltransferase
MPRDLIHSRSNALVRRLRDLKRHGGDDALALVEGVRLIEEAVAAGLDCEVVVASPRATRTPRGGELVNKLERAGTPMRWMEDAIVDSLASVETSQGLIALARRPVFAVEQVFAGTPLVVVLDGVQNPGNVGAVLRSAEAAGATGVLLTTECADPLSWKALRGSMGSAFRLPHVRTARTEILALLASTSVAVALAVPTSGRPPDEVDLRGPVALLVGGEGAGVSEELAGASQLHVSIPLQAPVESLNVAVATGILLFEAARQRRR